MSWNEATYWLAILALALAGAQFGISNISLSTYKGIFKREPSERMRQIMRTFPKFLAVMSIISIGIVILSAFELLWGFGSDAGLLIARHWNLLSSTTWVIIIQILMVIVMGVILFFILRVFWRMAERLPDSKNNPQQENRQLHNDLQQLIATIRESYKQDPRSPTKKRKGRTNKGG